MNGVNTVGDRAGGSFEGHGAYVGRRAEVPSVTFPAHPLRRRPARRFDWLGIAQWVLVAVGLVIAAALVYRASPAGCPAEPVSVARAVTPTVHLADPATTAQRVPRTKPIELVSIFDRVLGTNPQRTDADRTVAEPDPATWRVLRLRMAKASGRLLHIVLARPAAWVEQSGAEVGRTFFLDLPEMGAVGDADVLAIDPCPPLRPGPGSVVTGTFAHEADGHLVTVRLSDGVAPIGVTDNHPFWSEDRQDFVPAGQLRPGERLRTRAGAVAVATTSERPAAPGERVYNLEVHGEHVYQVTGSGVLVHNFCVDDFVRLWRGGQQVGNTATRTFRLTDHELDFVRQLLAQKPNLQIFRTHNTAKAGDFVILDRTNPRAVVGWVVELKTAAGSAHAGRQFTDAAEAATHFGLGAGRWRTLTGNIDELLAALSRGRRAW